MKLQEKMKDLADLQIEIDIALEEFVNVKDSMLSPEISAYIATVYYQSFSVTALYSNLFAFMPQASDTLSQLITKCGISAINPSSIQCAYVDERKCVDGQSMDSKRTEERLQSVKSTNMDNNGTSNTGSDSTSTDDVHNRSNNNLGNSQMTYIKLQYLMQQQKKLNAIYQQVACVLRDV